MLEINKNSYQNVCRNMIDFRLYEEMGFTQNRERPAQQNSRVTFG